MRFKHISAVALVGVSGVLGAASCGMGPEGASETEGGWDGPGASIASEDGGDLDVGVEPAGDARLLAVCLALAPASVPTKEAFCRSLPDSGSRGRCWQHRWNRAEWIGWCYAEFAE
jgi:hypothetical protein